MVEIATKDCVEYHIRDEFEDVLEESVWKTMAKKANTWLFLLGFLACAYSIVATDYKAVVALDGAIMACYCFMLVGEYKKIKNS